MDSDFVDLELHDTSSDSAKRPAEVMAQADIFIVCVAVDNLEAFGNVGKSVSELKKLGSQKPIVLVATKTDLRE